MHVGVRTALLACCLVLAGCGGLIGTQPTASQQSVTPAPVPEAPPQVAPGLTTDGVSDVDLLVRAHVAGLSNTSFTVDHRRTVEAVDGARHVQQTTRAEIGAGYRSYSAVRTITGPAVTDQVIRASSDDSRPIQWIMGDGTNSSRIVADGQDTGASDRSPRETLFFEPTFHGRVRALFVGANVTTVTPAGKVGGQFQGTSVFRVHADGAADRSQFPVGPASRIGDVRFTATVSPEGVVRAYEVRYTVVRNGTTLRVTESLRYTDVGTTTIDADGVEP